MLEDLEVDANGERSLRIVSDSRMRYTYKKNLPTKTAHSDNGRLGEALHDTIQNSGNEDPDSEPARLDEQACADFAEDFTDEGVGGGFIDASFGDAPSIKKEPFHTNKAQLNSAKLAARSPVKASRCACQYFEFDLSPFQSCRRRPRGKADNSSGLGPTRDI